MCSTHLPLGVGFASTTGFACPHFTSAHHKDLSVWFYILIPTRDKIAGIAAPYVVGRKNISVTRDWKGLIREKIAIWPIKVEYLTIMHNVYCLFVEYS